MKNINMYFPYALTDIPVISNLRVGYNLMDHIGMGGLTFLINETVSLKTERLINNKDLGDYLNNHHGPLSIPGGCEVNDT